MAGFDAANGKVQLYGDGTKPVSYISLFDVAKFAVQSLTNLVTKNAILELGGPEKLSQLDAIKIFEDISRNKIELSNGPVEALQLQMKTADDPMPKSFVGLMQCVAAGDPIDIEKTLENFPKN